MFCTLMSCPLCVLMFECMLTIVYVYGITKTEVATKLTHAIRKITTWLNKCFLQQNISKTVAMFFTITNSLSVDPDVLLDSSLKFRAQVK